MTSERIKVPEPDTGLVGGVLTEVWRSAGPLPTIRGWQIPLSYLNQGIRTVLAIPMSNTISVLTIAVALFLFTGFWLLLKNIDNVLSDVGGSFQLTAYLRADANPDDVSKALAELREDRSSIQSIEFVSKERALEIFRGDLGARSGLLAGLEQDNPLPASFEIVLQGDELKLDGQQKRIDRIKSLPIVEEVVLGSKWVERVQNVVQAFRFIASILLVVVLALIIFLIANTMKLVMYARRDEISIMQLVGATQAFVRVPFLIGGGLQGVAGALIALIFLSFSFSLVSRTVGDATMFGMVMPQLEFLGFGGAFMLVLLGGVIGAVGSRFAINEYLEV